MALSLSDVMGFEEGNQLGRRAEVARWGTEWYRRHQLLGAPVTPPRELAGLFVGTGPCTFIVVPWGGWILCVQCCPNPGKIGLWYIGPRCQARSECRSGGCLGLFSLSGLLICDILDSLHIGQAAELNESFACQSRGSGPLRTWAQRSIAPVIN